MKPQHPRLPSNKKFGFFFTLIFFISAIYSFIHGGLFFAFIFILISAVFLLLTIFFVDQLTILNRGWFTLGIYLGKMTNPIVLSILYFFLITPISMLSKAFHRDALRLRIKNKNSYWVVRSECSPINFKYQF